MAIDVLSGSNYRDLSNTMQRQDVRSTGSGYETSVMNSNNTVSASSSKTGSNQTIKDQDSGSKEQKLSDKQIKDAITRANNKIKKHRTRFEFNYHEETKRVSVKVIDKETDEIIREIPPEETLEMIEKIWELAGLLIDEKR